jgi:hypothetical protein
MPGVKHRQERLHKRDKLLNTHKHIENTEELLKKVHQKLDGDKQVSASNIDKDLNELQDEVKIDNIELLSKPNRYFHSNYHFFKQSLTEEDRTLLILAQILFQICMGTSLKNWFNDLVGKVITNRVPSKLLEDISKFQFIQLDSNVAAPNAYILPAPIQFINEKKVISVMYGPKKETKHLSPYVPRQNKGRWYFVVYCHSKTGEEAVKIYFLAREHHITENDKANHKTPDFIAQDFSKPSIGFWQQHGVKPINVEFEFSDPRLSRQFLKLHCIPPRRKFYVPAVYCAQRSKYIGRRSWRVSSWHKDINHGKEEQIFLKTKQIKELHSDLS